MNINVQDASMSAFNWRNLKRTDWLLPLLTLLLVGVGLITLYGAAYHQSGANFEKQCIFFGIGVCIVLFLVCVDYRAMVAWAPLWYAVGLILLAIVLFGGKEAKGSGRWIPMGPFNLQPSETMKIALIYMLAWYLNTIGMRIRKLHWFLLTFVIMGVPMMMILLQPNLGTSLTLVPICIAMLFVAGCRIRHFLLLVVGGALLIGPFVTWQLRNFDPEVKTQKETAYDLEWYQKKRIHSFLNRGDEDKKDDWQVYQSKISIGSGGLKGKGFLNSTQTKLHYLPENHTDFIFSVYAEERGFVGVCVILALYVAFLLRGLQFARQSEEMMGTLLAVGAVTILGFHIFVNIGITVGALPVTGLPLPFMSYGGSFYLATMACVGILLSIPIRKGMFED